MTTPLPLSKKKQLRNKQTIKRDVLIRNRFCEMVKKNNHGDFEIINSFDVHYFGFSMCFSS